LEKLEYVSVIPSRLLPLALEGSLGRNVNARTLVFKAWRSVWGA